MQRSLPNVWLCIGLAVAAALAAGRAARGQQWNFDESQFNAWITNSGASGAPAEILQTQVEMRVQAIEQVCTLSTEQRERLLLAGTGDVSRFETRIDVLRKKLVGKTYDQNKINEVYMEIQPLAQEFRNGVLGRGSLFARILDKTLDPDQKRRYEAAESRRRKANYAAKVSVYVAIVERGAPMTGQQRQALIEHIVAHTPPPAQFGSYDLQYVMYQASRTPEGRLREIFDDAQYKVIAALFQQGAGYEQWLEQQGIVAAETTEEPAGEAAAETPDADDTAGDNPDAAKEDAP